MSLEEGKKPKNSKVQIRRRLKQYDTAAGRKLIKFACEKSNITYKTVEKILRDFSLLDGSNAFANGKYDSLLENLPDLRHKKEYEIYRQSLEENGALLDSQKDLERFDGLYIIKSNIPESEITLGMIRIFINNSPFFPVFNLPVITKLDIVKHPRKCDGFINLDGSRLILTGMSKYINAFIFFDKAVDPKKDIMKGLAVIDNKISRKCYVSPIIVMTESVGLSTDVALIEERLGESYICF